MDLQGIIIDGAVPRSEYERCQTVLGYAQWLVNETDNVTAEQVSKIKCLEEEVEEPRILWSGHFPETEDDIIDLINDLLPDDLVCTLGEPNPGDVIVGEKEEVIW